MIDPFAGSGSTLLNLARRFQQRFPELIELGDAHQVARYELIRAAACLKRGCCTTAVLLKLSIYLRDHCPLVRLSRSEHEKTLTPEAIRASMHSAPANGLTSMASRNPLQRSGPWCPALGTLKIFAPWPLPLTTAEIGIQLLMDITAALMGERRETKFHAIS